MSSAPVIRIAAAIILDDDGRLLLVRKRGTTAFMQAGGKLEPGETGAEAIVRELREELGLVVEHPEFVGRVSADAANEAGHLVDCDLFRVPLVGAPRVQAEIEELIWLDPTHRGDIEIAPLTLEHVLPGLTPRSLRP